MKNFILPDMLLFTVEERYMLTHIGLTLCSTSTREGLLHTGEKIRLVNPDGTSCDAIVKSIAFHEQWSISVGSDLTKEDVPIGTEVWLDEKKIDQ